MPEGQNQTTIIIRKTQGAAAAGHHGGAWKVAYADFVTAMMAFFLLLWLLNATTEKQRAGLADYFNPTLIHQRNGGAATLEGQNTAPTPVMDGVMSPDALAALAHAVESALKAAGGESMQNRALLRHVVTRLTDEGLVIELGDLTDEPLFLADSAEPTPALRELARIVANALARTRNDLAFTGHVAGVSAVRADSPAWPLSGQRAHAVRALIEGAGITPLRTQRVTAYGDRRNRSQNPMDAGNNRVEVILLR